MANEEHLKILKQGVKLWNKWREDNPEIKPDLQKTVLRGTHLREANHTLPNLYGADLSGVNLSGSNLRKADLFGANFKEANLREVNLWEKRRGQIFYFDISFFINTICQFQRSDPLSFLNVKHFKMICVS